MSGRKIDKEMVATKSKYKAISCSTPEHTLASPSRDSDSEAASPVPFLCTQDGAEGETDVVWNYNTTNSINTRYPKNTTPLSRKTKKNIRPKLPEKSLPKRKVTRLTQKNSQLFQDLIELNQKINNLIEKKSKPSNADKPQSGSEEDIFSEAIDCSPKSVLRSSSRCLRKNVLSSKFGKPESDNGLESDDSMNECLLKASQVVEDNILNIDPPAKRPCFEPARAVLPYLDLTNDDSMDAILKNVSSPYINKVKCDSPGLNNDSFDNLVGNLNDSVLDQLTQMPVKHDSSKQSRRNSKDSEWMVREIVVHNGSPTKVSLARHSSMPESPSVNNKPSTSSVPLGRYNSMPFNNSAGKISQPGDSPIKCTPTEIQKKHQLARERLLAKRLLPFTPTQQTSQSLPTQPSKPMSEQSKKIKFQPKVPSSTITSKGKSENITKSNESTVKPPIVKSVENAPQPTNPLDIKSLIERNRQEALMRLRKRQMGTAGDNHLNKLL